VIIYKITNLINGKVYIGKTEVSLNQQWSKHKSDSKLGSKLAIHNAMRKYGVSNFSISEIDGANSSSELSYKEVFHIYKQNSLFPVGYNLALGSKLHYESRKKISIKIKAIVPKEQLKSMTELSKIKSTRKVKFENLETKEVTEVGSFSELNKLGFNSKYICEMLNGRKSYIPYKGYWFWHSNDSTYLSKRSGKRSPHSSFKCLDTRDNSIRFFERKCDLLKELKLNKNTVNSAIKLNKLCKDIFKIESISFNEFANNAGGQ
jgi:group I intron endonuclease